MAAGVWAVSRLDLSKDKDPQFVVMDEVLGIFLTFFLVPISLKTALVGFLLFRLFDILKPFPCRRLEKLPRFWGIAADDLMAGFYSWLILFFFFR
jgi:phosphatidylglycerophosphatase A